MDFPALSDTDCSVFIASINQSMLPAASLYVHSFSQSLACSLVYRAAVEVP